MSVCESASPLLQTYDERCFGFNLFVYSFSIKVPSLFILSAIFCKALSVANGRPNLSSDAHVVIKQIQHINSLICIN